MTRLTYTAARARALVSPLLTADATRPEEVYASAVWTAIAEAGDRVAGALVQTIGAVDALRLVLAGGDGRDAAEVTGREWADAQKRWQPRLIQEDVDAAFERAARAGVRLIAPGDRSWPVQLGDLGFNSPLCLWVRGDPGVFERLHPAVALVGARAATGYGEHVTRELAGDLVQRGFAIVSGAAYGIDGAAHRAALDAGGLTVAFMAGGVDRPYPMGHVDLLERIAAGGAVVSEVPCGGTPTKWRSVDRTSARGLAQGVAVSFACSCSVARWLSTIRRSGSLWVRTVPPSLRSKRSCLISGRQGTRSRAAGRTRLVCSGGTGTLN